MSQRPIAASGDLSRLANEGFDIAVQDGHLVVRGVPFLDACGVVRRGTLISTLDLAGDRTVPPRNHVAYFGGGTPCDARGTMLIMLHGHHPRRLAAGLAVDHMLSSRPAEGEYPDYHAKITTYVAQIEAPAQSVDPAVSARQGVTTSTAGFSPFRYVDTASSRAGIGAYGDRLSRQSVAIVGLGGTGSYILDLVAKTTVGRIHLWDSDVFEQHSAFRCPGAPSVEEIAARPSKVDHLSRIYSRMHRGIVPHPSRLGPSNVKVLANLDFVFLAIDSEDGRRPLVEFLEGAGRSFIDVGMGLQLSDQGIVGTLRVTTSTAAMRDHVRDRGRIPMGGGRGDDPYSTNVQVADLNCLNAALAVIRWKRHFGFYADLEREHWSAYSIDGNRIFNEEQVSGDPA